jgi:hypothetical protein
MIDLAHYAGIPITGALIGLAGLAYRDILRRLSHCESVDEKMGPTMVEIATDVKHVLAHCKLCKNER